ncbi:MAG TPA: four helix bundle protein [Ohtaekwangia sp.]|uniref:four helix bundle protein n=1 Tax=Ohtaekwangia sp. TaxID=2066019 RepID=UPI002F95EBB0
MKNYKKLKIWQKGMDIVLATYRLAAQLPIEEKFGLRSQVTRCSVSIPSNIAEGSAKSSKKDYKNYLEISLGSTYELETQVLIIDMLEIGDKALRSSLLDLLDEEQKMLQSFIQKIGE